MGCLILVILHPMMKPIQHAQDAGRKASNDMDSMEKRIDQSLREQESINVMIGALIDFVTLLPIYIGLAVTGLYGALQLAMWWPL